MHGTELGILLPESAMVWCLVIAGGAFILGARRLALAVGAIPLFCWFVWPLLGEVFPALPWWAQLAMLVGMPLLLVHRLVATVFGPETAGHFTGTWLVRLVDGLFTGAARSVSALVRRLIGGRAP